MNEREFGRLSMFIDNELKDSSSLQSKIRNDPGAVEVVEKLSEVDAALIRAAARMDETPYSPNLEDLLGQLIMSPSEKGRGFADAVQRVARTFLAVYVPAAAVASLVAVAVFGLRPTTNQGPSVAVLDVELAEALSAVGDGDQSGQIFVGATYRRKDGVICRTFGPSAPRLVTGVACREQPETWLLIALSPEPGADAYLLAGGDGGDQVAPIVEAAISSMTRLESPETEIALR